MTMLAFHRSKINWPRRASTGSLTACAAALAVGLVSPLPRTLRADPTPAATATPAAATPLDALDVAKLRPHVNEKVEVRGTPTASGHNKTGSIVYLNFAGAHQAMSLVFFLKPGQTGKAGTEDDVKPFVGKPIVVTGTLADYKGDLQIVVDSLDQIKAAP